MGEPRREEREKPPKENLGNPREELGKPPKENPERPLREEELPRNIKEDLRRKSLEGLIEKSRRSKGELRRGNLRELRENLGERRLSAKLRGRLGLGGQGLKEKGKEEK